MKLVDMMKNGILYSPFSSDVVIPVEYRNECDSCAHVNGDCSKCANCGSAIGRCSLDSEQTL